MLSIGKKIVILMTLSVLLTASLAGQTGEGSQWSTIPVDASIAIIEKRSNTLAVQNPTNVLLYSAILREWTWVDTSSAALVTAQNEHAIIEDTPVIHGWSCRTGEVDSINISASGYIVPGPSSANYLVLVHDGTTVYAFSAYDGHWVPLTLTTSTPTIALGRSCAVVLEGNTAYAFSAYYDTWQPLSSITSTTAVGANGHVAFVNSATELRLFSADTNTWHTMTVKDTTQFTANSNYALLVENDTVTAFSAYRGTFAAYTASAPGFTIDDGTNVAALIDTNGTTVSCYSAHQGIFSSTSMTSPNVFVKTDYVIVESVSDSQAVAFSGVLGAYSASISGTFTFYTDSSVAFAEGSGTNSHAYSAVHNEWVPAPPVAYLSIDLLNTSVIMTLYPEGFAAFSARYKKWFELTPSGSATLHPLHSKGTVAVVSDANALYAWDARVGRWVKATVPVSTLSNLEAKFGTVLAENGYTGYGFGIYDGLWDTVQINGDVLYFDPGSGAGYIQTDNFLHVYSRSGSLSTVSTYPEASPPQFIGTGLGISQVAPQGSSVLMGVNTDPGYSLTPWGVLFLKNLAYLYSMPPVPANGRLDIGLVVPNDPLLIGLSFHFQNIILPPSGILYLTNSISIVTM